MVFETNFIYFSKVFDYELLFSHFHTKGPTCPIYVDLILSQSIEKHMFDKGEGSFL